MSSQNWQYHFGGGISKMVHCAKNKPNIRQNSALWSYRAQFCPILFVLGSRKNAFEIYWPLEITQSELGPSDNFLDVLFEF